MSLKADKYQLLFWGSISLFLIALFFFLPEKCHGGDVGHWVRWTGFMMEEGFANIYDYGYLYPTEFACNYPPVLLYFLYGYGIIINDLDFIIAEQHYFKVIPLIFDFIGAISIFLLVKKTSRNWFLPFLLLLSPAYFYNSYCWGQVDSIHTSLIVLALIFALRKAPVWATAFFIIALNTKMQAIIFFPVFALAILPVLNWKSFGRALLIAVLIQAILLAPFIFNGTLSGWNHAMTGLVDQYTNLSLFAYNIWHLLLDPDTALYTKDYEVFWLGWTYKSWGLFFFFSFSFIALIPLLIKSINVTINKKPIDQSFQSLVLLSAFLCVLGFFFFNTQMHERYAHPVLLLSFLVGVLRRKYWLYFICSLAYFLNMERVLKFWDISHTGFIFSEWFIAGLYLLALSIGLVYLYKNNTPFRAIKGLLKKESPTYKQ